MTVTESFDELVRACDQDFTTPYFNEQNFPLEPVAPDEDEWEVCEYRFKTKVTGQDAFRQLRAMGYRILDGPRRAMEYMADNPKSQTNHPVIVTAIWQHNNLSWYAPLFRERNGYHYLDLINLDRKFKTKYRWLVLRKKTDKGS